MNESDTTYVFDIPYHANENMDVGQIVFRSSALDKIHHCNYFFVPNDAKDFSFNNMIYAGGYSPGNMQYPFAYGTGFRLPKNGHIRGELHVPPLSKAIDFSIYFSLYKSIKPISETLYLIPLANLKPDNTTTFFIPADTLITFTGHTKLMEDATLCNVNPHMHLLGKSVTAFAITPANDTVPLINIPKWNFNWQDFYEFEQPIFLPKNSTIVLQMTYDNTTQNPSNPNRPPVLITEGWYTSQEMFTLLLIAKKKNL